MDKKRKIPKLILIISLAHIALMIFNSFTAPARELGQIIITLVLFAALLFLLKASRIARLIITFVDVAAIIVFCIAIFQVQIYSDVFMLISLIVGAIIATAELFILWRVKESREFFRFLEKSTPASPEV